MNTLLVLPGTPEGDALLLRRGTDPVRGDIDTLAAQASPPYAAVLPGQLVRGLLTDMPDKLKAAERLSIARFAHEDALAGDPMAAHVVVGPGSPAPTLILAPDVMDGLLERVDPSAVYVDFDLLSEFSGPTRLLDRVVTPGLPGDAVDLDWAEDGYAQPTDEALADAMFSRLDAGGALDLRTGPYRSRRAFRAGPWGRVAAVALACAALGLLVVGADARAVGMQADQLSAKARTDYTAATGQPAPAQLSSLARQVRTDDGSPTQFLDLSQSLFTAVAATPGTQVERLSFEAREGVLRVRLLYPDFDAAAALEEAVARAGGSLTTGNVREQNGQYVGDAAITGAGS